jgi:DNA-binding IclR family transcriptional regulator
MDMVAFTSNTAASVATLQGSIDATRKTGFARTAGTFEADVHSLAAPLFDQTGFFAGAVSAASVATRFTPELERIVKTHLVTASRRITHNWGGAVPADIEQAWAAAQAPSPELEITR